LREEVGRGEGKSQYLKYRLFFVLFVIPTVPQDGNVDPIFIFKNSLVQVRDVLKVIQVTQINHDLAPSYHSSTTPCFAGETSSTELRGSEMGGIKFSGCFLPTWLQVGGRSGP
jgi:hypothetical protein